MPFNRSSLAVFLVFAAFFICAGNLHAQSKKKNPARKTSQSIVAPEPKNETPVAASPSPEPAIKRNARPDDRVAATDANTVPGQTTPKPDPNYFYEFTQPEFITNRITIEHDDNGKGTISFTRRGSSEVISDPLQVSSASMSRLKAAFAALNFLDSTEDYQYSKDYSHLGNMKISLTKGGRERVAKFNYTLNKDAKALADEYRKISNQAVWIFDITVARENQPLDGPTQMDSLESLIKRGEISDPQQLVPLLRELSDDERLPLIARNHAARIIQQIEKAKK